MIKNELHWPNENERSDIIAQYTILHNKEDIQIKDFVLFLNSPDSACQVKHTVKSMHSIKGLNTDLQLCMLSLQPVYLHFQNKNVKPGIFG